MKKIFKEFKPEFNTNSISNTDTNFIPKVKQETIDNQSLFNTLNI